MRSACKKVQRVLVLTDNIHMLEKFQAITSSHTTSAETFDYRYSPRNNSFTSRFGPESDFRPLDVKKDTEDVIRNYDLVFSIHCKQLFPARLVRAVRCINVHPGLNPFNRGWYPQVFSILNGFPLGATIHEMDEQLDHGPIIDQLEVPIFEWDTSLSAYERVLQAEEELLHRNFERILRGDYKVRMPSSDGNVNLKADFNALCRLDLNQTATFAEFLDRLRALSHGDFRNAYFISRDGLKVFVRVNLERESN